MSYKDVEYHGMLTSDEFIGSGKEFLVEVQLDAFTMPYITSELKSDHTQTLDADVQQRKREV